MSEDALLTADGLSKTFRIGFWRKKVEAVRDVTFSVRQGEIFGLIGPNGAGKTTTMKMLTGLIFPDAGEMTMFGESIEHVEMRSRLGYLPENPYFYEHLSARELLVYYGNLHGQSRTDAKRRAEGLLERVGLKDAADRAIRKFSKGMRQRVGIAQALINDPELVILDEPQSGLDPVGRKEVRDLIVELKEDGKTVFFSSHILPDVEAVCDRIAVMHEGTLRETGSLDELTHSRGTSYELMVRGLTPEDANALPMTTSAQKRADMTVIEFEAGADIDDILESVQDTGAKLHSLTPQKENLEDVFLRDTQDDDDPSHTTSNN
ncbi:MAG: ABC transporter ATP-binding protein [Myxococcota bacterium]